MKESVFMQGDDIDIDTEQEQPTESLEQFVKGMHIFNTSDNGMPSHEWLKDTFKTKSAIIRYMKDLGYTPKQASDHLGFKYQHVYNVMHQELKRGPNEVYTEQAWQCPHTNAPIIIDVVARKGNRDANATRILYRICSTCAEGLIPGVTQDSIAKALPAIANQQGTKS